MELTNDFLVQDFEEIIIKRAFSYIIPPDILSIT